MAGGGDKNTSFLEEENRSNLEEVVNSNGPKSDQELLLLVVHTVLYENGFRVVSIGKFEGDNTAFLEGRALPDRWNKQADPDCYEFTYINLETKKLFALRALLIEDKLCLNLLQQGKGHASATEVQVVVADHVVVKQQPITLEWLVDVGFLWKKIERGLFRKHEDLFERRDFELHSKLLEQERPRQTKRTQHILHEGIPAQPLQANFPSPSPFAYGDADRLPGHPGMGGMLMDPFRSGGMGLRPPGQPGIPRGSVPPGARFDPFGPLTEFDYSAGDRRPRRSFDPNPDHLRRPGFDDDMFM